MTTTQADIPDEGGTLYIPSWRQVGPPQVFHRPLGFSALHAGFLAVAPSPQDFLQLSPGFLGFSLFSLGLKCLIFSWEQIYLKLFRYLPSRIVFSFRDCSKLGLCANRDDQLVYIGWTWELRFLPLMKIGVNRVAMATLSVMGFLPYISGVFAGWWVFWSR